MKWKERKVIYTLKQIEAFSKRCTQCPLFETRNNTVFGEGSPKADIIFIGEAPGFNEDKTGEVFVGKAGKLLDKMLQAIHLKREDIYITNIVKCRPPDNRNPSEKECRICIEYLRWQVKIIEPTIIVCLGAVASKNIINKNFKISKERGTWISRGKYSIIATYHPAALLRDQSRKREAWEDLQKISRKLRGYNNKQESKKFWNFLR